MILKETPLPKLSSQLFQKIDRQTARVGIIGLGYVGLPLAEAFAGGGFRVLGFDIDGEKIEKLKRGESYIGHIPGERITELMRTSRFEPVADPRALPARMSLSFACRPR